MSTVKRLRFPVAFLPGRVAVGGPWPWSLFQHSTVARSIGVCIFVVAVAAFATVPTLASIIVNVDATLYGDPTRGLPTLNVSESAGSYLITPADPQTDPRALFTAWDPYSPPTVEWDSEVFITQASTGQTFVTGEDAAFSTPAQAFTDSLNKPLIITLSTADTLEFYVPDWYLPDNQGGVSETIEPLSSIPEPTALAVLGAGLLGLGLVRRRA